MWQQHYFTPRATACHKPPESQPVCSIASLLVMRVASQPICQLANLPICQPYIRIGRQRVQQTKLQPDFTPGVKAWHMPPAGLPGSSKASLPGSQFASACQKPPESQPVCFIANLLVMRVASQPIWQLPICQWAGLAVGCQPYIRIGRQRVQQTKLQPDFTPGVKAWHISPAGLPGSSKASLPGSQFARRPICQPASGCQPCNPIASLPAARQPVCQQASQSVVSRFASRFGSKPIRQRVSQFVASLSASQSVCQRASQFTSVPASPPASLPASQSVSQLPPVCQSVCQYANSLASQSVCSQLVSQPVGLPAD